MIRAKGQKAGEKYYKNVERARRITLNKARNGLQALSVYFIEKLSDFERNS